MRTAPLERDAGRAPSGVPTLRRLPLRSAVGLVAVLIVFAVFGAMALRISRWWNGPAAVPDHATTFSGTQAMVFAGTGTLAQRVRPAVDGLAAVDLIVAAERAGLPGAAQLQVEEYPSGRVLRTAQVPAARAPAGSAWDLRPGSPREQWLTFGFEPIPDSAEKEYWLVLSYPSPDGVDQPGSRLATLAQFSSRYAPDQLLINGSPAAGVLLARLAAAGTHGQAVQVALANLARTQPLATGTLVFPTLAAVFALGFAGALVWAMYAMGRPERGAEPW